MERKRRRMSACLMMMLCGVLIAAGCGGRNKEQNTAAAEETAVAAETGESAGDVQPTSGGKSPAGSSAEQSAGGGNAADSVSNTTSGLETGEAESAPETAASSAGTVLAATAVNVRSQPSTESQVLGKLSPGTEVDRLSDDGQWSTVQYEGKTAYIASEYLYDPSAQIPPLEHPAEIPTEPGTIFNTQMNENGKYRGGKQGDQTGTEARTEKYPAYYEVSSYPWKCLLRCKDAHLASAAVEEACAAAENENIGYDSGDLRLTLWDEVQKTGFDTSLVETPCAANCVTSLLTFYKCAGQRLGIDSVADLNVDGHVYTEEDILLGTGFFERVDDADLHSADANHAGDVYIAESHTILQLTDGAEADSGAK